MIPRLLLVEDDPHDVLFLRKAFAKIGWEVSLNVETDGQGALDHLCRRGSHDGRDLSQCPTHVILDLKLPRISGLDVLKGIRSAPDLSALPVILLTSSHEPEDIARAFTLGCDGYLVKPVTFENLVRVAGSLRDWATRAVAPRIPEAVYPSNRAEGPGR